MAINKVLVNSSQILSFDEQSSYKSNNVVKSNGIYEATHFLHSNQTTNFFSTDLLLNRNCLIASQSQGQVYDYPMEQVGYARTTQSIQIPNGDVQSLYWYDIGGISPVPMRCAFKYTNTLDATPEAIQYDFGPAGPNHRYENGLIPIKQFYDQGYRYIIIEITRGSQTPISLDDVVLIWMYEDSKALKDVVWNNVLEIEKLKARGKHIDYFFDESLVYPGNYLIQWQQGTYVYVPVEEFGYCRTSVMIEIPTGAISFYYKGGRQVPDVTLPKMAFYKVNQMGGDFELFDFTFQEIVVPLDAYVSKGYHYIVVELYRGLDYEYDLSKIRFGWVTNEGIDVDEEIADIYEHIGIIEDKLNTISYNPNFITPSNLLRKNRVSVNFSFDDSVSQDSQVKAVFDEFGYKCAFAIITASQRYLDYAKEGFEIMAHNGTPLGSATEAQIRESMEHGKSVVESLGLICHGWVTPSSTLNPTYTWVVKDYFEYGFTVYKGNQYTDQTHTTSVKSSELWRIHMDQLKDHYEMVFSDMIQKNGMVSVYAHASELGGSGWTLNDLRTILQYCKTNGIDVFVPYLSCLKLYSDLHE